MGMNAKKKSKKTSTTRLVISIGMRQSRGGKQEGKSQGQKGGYGTRGFQSRVDRNGGENMLSDDSPSSGSEDAETP